jgi:hypothetical protein
MKMFKKIKENKIFGYITNATFVGLIISVAIATFQIKQANDHSKSLAESLERIENVEKSVTTHFLGAFPEYISEINRLLEDYQHTYTDLSKDTIVIFEDVLYYGIRSSPNEFIKMNKLLLGLADEGCHIVIAYYAPERNPIFKLMVQDELIAPIFYAEMNEKMSEDRNLRDTYREEYFDRSRKATEESRLRYEKKVADMRTTLFSELLPNVTPLDKEIRDLCRELDSIKHFYMGDAKKDVMSITFNDFAEMYKSMDLQIKKHYVRNERTNFIELIELREFLTMSCWLVRGKAILAFPSKYSSEEIGFSSQDNAFVEYIETMLNGVRSSTSKETTSK